MRPFRRRRRRPRVFGLAGFKPALTENHRPFELDGWGSGAPMLLPPRLRGFDEHETLGCLRRGRRFHGLGGRGALCRPNVRAKRATTAGRQRPDGENVLRTTGRALVACRWRSA